MAPPHDDDDNKLGKLLESARCEAEKWSDQDIYVSIEDGVISGRDTRGEVWKKSRNDELLQDRTPSWVTLSLLIILAATILGIGVLIALDKLDGREAGALLLLTAIPTFALLGKVLRTRRQQAGADGPGSTGGQWRLRDERHDGFYCGFTYDGDRATLEIGRGSKEVTWARREDAEAAADELRATVATGRLPTQTTA